MGTAPRGCGGSGQLRVSRGLCFGFSCEVAPCTVFFFPFSCYTRTLGNQTLQPYRQQMKSQRGRKRAFKSRTGPWGGGFALWPGSRIWATSPQPGGPHRCPVLPGSAGPAFLSLLLPRALPGLCDRLAVTSAHNPLRRQQPRALRSGSKTTPPRPWKASKPQPQTFSGPKSEWRPCTERARRGRGP